MHPHFIRLLADFIATYCALHLGWSGIVLVARGAKTDGHMVAGWAVVALYVLFIIGAIWL
jgi:hypothetical protein